MAKLKYAAGFHYITSTSDQILNKEDRRAIRSHVTKAQGKRRKAVQLRSWIDPDRRLGFVKESESPETPFLSVPSPRRVGGDFSALQLPLGIEPAMIQDLVKLINLDIQGVYPYEVCLHVHPVERGWFPYMISDICCIHSMMFSVRAFVDTASQGGQISRLAAFHYDQTLQLLQARLNAFEQGQQDLVFCDSTIMVINTLAEAAELTGDYAAAENHIDGLLKIVSLRGGLRSLNTHHNMQVKVCRADLRLALRSGNPSRLFREGIAWDRFIADRGVIRCSHEPHETQIHAFMDGLDLRLANSWKDLHAFSCMSNLAYQTTRKLSPDIYNEMMFSILYRLMHLSFKGDPLQEVIRTSLLIFSSTIFLTRHYMNQRHEHLFNLFSSALANLHQSTSNIVPPPIMLWLMVLYTMVAYRELSPENWLSVWLDKAAPLTTVDTWPQAHIILRSVMWVGFVHDASGKKAFEAAIQRVERFKEFDIEYGSL